MLNQGWKTGDCPERPSVGALRFREEGTAPSSGTNTAIVYLLLALLAGGCQIASPGGTQAANPTVTGGPTAGQYGCAIREVSDTTPANTPSNTPAYDPSVQNLGTSLTNVKPAKKDDDDDDSGFDWSSLDPANIYKNIKAKLGYGPNEPLAEQVFKEGMLLYREKKYEEAVKKFAISADRWPDSPLEEDSLFFQAESYFFADRYNDAHDILLELFKKYSNTRYLDVAASREFQIARYWDQKDQFEQHWPITPNFFDKTRPWFDTYGNAVNAYSSVHINDPTGPLADASIMAMASGDFDRGRYEDAAANYRTLIRNYPKSQYQVKAHLMGVEAEKLIYQGPMYDGKPLDEADQLAKQALTQFRDQIADHRSRLLEEREYINERRAERTWVMGQYWETKRSYGAARICYDTTIKEHPGSHFAELAQQRLIEIKDKPADPPNHMQWLTNLSNALKERP